MKRNAINFNGKGQCISEFEECQISSSDSNSLISVGTALANEATEIFDFVKRTIEQNRDEFNQMEQ